MSFFGGSLFDEPTDTHAEYVPPEPPSLDGMDRITIDLETNGLKWHRGHRPIGIGLCRPDGSTLYLPFGHKQGKNLDETTVKRWAERELRNKIITNISTKFDIHHLREWGIDLEAQGCTVEDVAFDAALLDDHREKFSLESLCLDFLPEHERKVTTVDGNVIDSARMAEYPSGMIAVRCEADVRQVHLLKQIFQPRIIDENLTRVQAVENECIFPVCEMERNAMHLDVELLRTWNTEVERSTQSMLMTIAKEVGFSVNPDASKDWRRLFEKLEIPFVKSKSGEPSFTDEILQRINHPIVQRLRYIGKLLSLRSKYLQSYSQLVEADGRLRYNLHQLRSDDVGTITGRFSSSEVNIQQVPKAKKQTDTKDYLIRQLFIPPPGRLFFSADAKQIEYRIFAHYANSPRLTQAFEENPQLNFHQLIFETLSPYTKKLTYEHTKNINFMRIYGGGIVKLAMMMGFVTKETADRLQLERRAWRSEQEQHSEPLEQPELDSVMEIDKIYNEQLPEVKPLLEKAKRLAESRGHICTMLGRRGRFKTHAQKRFSYKAFNFVGQGGGADYMKVKLIELHRSRKLTGFVMRATVHDQVLGDVPDLESARLVHGILDRQAFKLKIPILWDMKTGANWKECD